MLLCRTLFYRENYIYIDIDINIEENKGKYSIIQLNEMFEVY